MELNDLFKKVSDPYERQARLWPALLVLFPLFTILALLYGSKMSALTSIVTLGTSCGGLYLLINASREQGKRLEPKLYKAWGGKPTTQLLRHRDATIEEVTKLRYHSFLSGRIGVPFPDPQQEISDPYAADDVYQSGVRWLLEHTRDTKRFSLLFQENIAYGFRRNALALKPFGLVCALGSAIWVFVIHEVTTTSHKYFFNKAALIALPETAIISLMVSLFMILIWTLFFTKTSTRTAGFTYAEMLLRSCDVLDKK